MRSFPELAIVVLTRPQQPWPEYRRRFLEAWAASPIQPVPGRLIYWPPRTASLVAAQPSWTLFVE